MSILGNLPENVRVVEVGPRDGLQNEHKAISADEKITYINLLGEAGYNIIEATSFVNPKAIPQLADAQEVMAGINRAAGLEYMALVPNMKGMERALESGLERIAVFTAASNSFTQHNINMTIDESFQTFAPVIRVAKEAGVWVRGYISTCFGCPYEGEVEPEQVMRVAEKLLDLGAVELSIGDTIGVATPNQVCQVVEALLKIADLEKLALHFHDTRGTALANVLAGLQMGVATFDSSSGGLGGCPYAPGAAGNLATEDLLYMLEGLGISTGVSLPKVVEATTYILQVLSKQSTSKYYQAAMKATY